MNTMWRFYRWYDGLSELNQLFIFLAFSMTGIMLLAFGNEIFIVIGAICIIFIVSACVYCVTHLSKEIISFKELYEIFNGGDTSSLGNKAVVAQKILKREGIQS